MRSVLKAVHRAALRTPIVGGLVPDPRDFLLRMMPPNSVCAEIGVWKGGFSRRILRVARPKALHLIDPWAFQSEFPKTWFGGTQAGSQGDMDRIHDEVARTVGADPRVTMHREFSEAAAGKFPDGFFDWVYIDGNHYYEYVKRDLELYAPKVRAGGFICGDDFFFPPVNEYPVKRAVEEFAARPGIQLVTVKHGNFVLKKA